MAKKSKTQKENNPQNQTHQPIIAAATDSEKLDNLKNLNKMLIKETKDRREQVEALVRSKGSLESALKNSESEKNLLRSELTQLLDKKDVFELEKVVVSVVVGDRLEAVVRERDGLRREKVEMEEKVRSLEREIRGGESFLKRELSDKIEEINGLRVKVGEIEERERGVLGVSERVRDKYDGVVRERDERDRVIGELKREKVCLEKCLRESNRVVEELKGEIAEMGREMREIEEKGRVEVEKKIELEKKVFVLNELLLHLRNEEKLLRRSVAELERRERERVEEAKRMAREIDGLLSVKEESARRLEGSVEENGKVENRLKGALKEIDELNRKIDEIVREKIVTEEAKRGIEVEMVRLKGEISELRVGISVLEAKNKMKTEENKGLSIEVIRTREEIARVRSERDDARKGFEGEREICGGLRKKVSKMEKKIKETEKVLAGIQSENRSVHEEKKGLKGEYDVLKNKVASLERTRLKDNKEINHLRAKLLKSDANLRYVLKFVKEVRDGKLDIDEGGDSAKEIRPCLDELVAIRRVIREGEAKIEEMKEQVDLLNNSVEAHKKKSFWAVLSSVTSVLVAASVASAAYIARGH